MSIVIEKGLPSPLRYPGGKGPLAGFIALILEKNLMTGCTFYETYAGSAAVSLALLKEDYIQEAVLVERDPLIYAFWKSVFEHTDRLCNEIKRCDVSLLTWHRLQPYRKVDNFTSFPIVKMGLAGLFFNRTNYSGILHAGPIGGQRQSSDYDIGCRFKKERLIRLVQNIAPYRKRVRVYYDDAVNFMQKHNKKITGGNGFVYLDPPYYAKGKKLYRYNHNHLQHLELSNHISKQSYPWLLSYDEHDSIYEMYKGMRINRIDLFSAISSCKVSCELLISNGKLAIPLPEKQREESIPFLSRWGDTFAQPQLGAN